MAVYAFRQNHAIKGLSAQTIGNELESIRSRQGKITAEIVLEEAFDPDSPLHGGFTWEDTEAARQWRLQEARRLIVSVRVLTPDTARNNAPCFVSVRTLENGRNYLPAAEVLSNDDMRERLLDEIRGFIETLERRYKHFEELAGIIRSIKKSVA